MLRVSLVAFLVLLVVPSAGAQQAPDQVHVSVAGTVKDGTTSSPDVSQLVIHWSVAQAYLPSLSPRVKYSVDGGQEMSAPASLVGVARDYSPPTARDEHEVLPIYAARLRVPLGSNVTYSVGEGSTFSAPATVKSLPKPTGGATVVALSHLGYKGYDRQGLRQVGVEAPQEATMRAALNQSPDVALFAGQLAYSSSNKPWNGFMRSSQPLQSSVITLAVPGEAETPDGHHQLRERYVLPLVKETAAQAEGEETELLYHALTIGPMYVIGLDSSQLCVATQGQPPVPPCAAGRPDQTQISWLHDVLEDAREDYRPAWVVVYLNHGPYMYADDGDDLVVRQLLTPLFETYNVDLVIHSNEAIYQRTHPLRNQVPLAKGDHLPAGLAPIYVTPGTAGAATPIGPTTDRHPDWVAKIGFDGFTFLRIDATSRTLTVRAIEADNGTTIDSFLIDKALLPAHLPASSTATPTPVAGRAAAPGLSLLILTAFALLLARRIHRGAP